MTFKITFLIALMLGSSVTLAANKPVAEQNLLSESKQAEGQDPTAPLGWEKPAEVKSTAKKTVTYRLPTLKSIACDDKDRCNAVLNNSIVKKGDKLNGYQVRQISDENVTLVRGSQLWTLELFSLDIKN